MNEICYCYVLNFFIFSYPPKLPARNLDSAQTKHFPVISAKSWIKKVPFVWAESIVWNYISFCMRRFPNIFLKNSIIFPGTPQTRGVAQIEALAILYNFPNQYMGWLSLHQFLWMISNFTLKKFGVIEILIGHTDTTECRNSRSNSIDSG